MQSLRRDVEICDGIGFLDVDEVVEQTTRAHQVLGLEVNDANKNRENRKQNL